MPLTSPLAIPFTWPYNPRAANSNRDPRRQNVINERVGDETYVLKRPGTELAYSLGSGFAQGITAYNGSYYAVIDDVFRSVGANDNTGTSGSAFTQSTLPPWAGRELAGAVVFLDRMWVMSGVTSPPSLTPSATYIADVWSSTDGLTWVAASAGAPWVGRHGFGVAVLGKKMFIAGGYEAQSGAYLNDVWSTENGTDWVRVSDEATGAEWNGRAAHGFVASSSGMYVIGGVGAAGAFDDVWFSSDGIKWSRIGGAFGWGDRYLFGCLYFQNSLWIIAGYSGSGAAPTNDVWSSRDAGQTWVQATAAAFGSATYALACCVYNNKMWALGGSNGSSELTNVYSSNLTGTTWSLVTSSPGWTGRAGSNALVFRTPDTVSTYRYPTIWMVAGQTSGGVANAEVWRGDLDTALGTSIALSPTITGQYYQFNSFQTATRLLIKNQSNMWVYDSGSITVVTEAGYPATTVPGIVVLGGSAYVMDPSGLIYSCALDNPYYWPALNVLGADYEDDAGVCLVKYLNYVVAFGAYTTQVFYDAGLATGSPLKPYLNANMKIGCANAYTVCQVGTTVAWVGQTPQGSRSVFVFEGLTPKPISTPAIDKMITRQTDPAQMRAYTFSANGHVFYVLSTASSALVYDFTEKEWYEWSMPNNSQFSFFAAADLTSTSTYLLHPTNGSVLRTGLELYDDSGTPFPVYIRTGTFDANTRRTKFWGRLDVVGDQNVGTPGIAYSDDDGQTYTTLRTVDMNTPRPALFRNGASRYRIFYYQQVDSNPMRIERLEQQFEIGT